MKARKKQLISAYFWRFLAASLPFLLILGTFGINPSTALATIPKYINFQSKITQTADGTNVSNGSYTVEFKIYDSLSGGSLLWTETWDGSPAECPQLTVTNGVFNAKLGACNSLSSVDFTTGSLYLSVNFNADGEMSPRKQLVSAPFAFVANSLNGDGTIDLADFDTDSDGKTTIAPDTAGDALTISTTAAEDLQGLVISSSSSTQTAGIIQVTSNTVTNNAILGLALAGTVQDAASGLTVYGNKVNLTVDTDAGQNHTAYGTHITIDNDDAGSTVYGLYVDADGDGGGEGTEYAGAFLNGNVGIGDATPSALLEVGNGTDSLQVSSSGDLTFVDADSSASITGPAGGAFSVVAGASQALTLTGNNTSTWSTSSGSLTVQGATTLALTAASGAVTVTSTGATNDINLVSADIISLLPAGFVIQVGGGTSRTALRFLEPSGTGTDYTAIQANADVTTSYTWTLPAADASGCIQSNGAGVLSIAACGGGSQTPWTSNIDADAYALQDALNIEFRTAVGSAPAGSVIALYADNSGDLTANVLTGKTLNIAVNGTDEYNFSSTALAMNSNNITGLGTALTATAGLTVTATNADLTLATSTSGHVLLSPATGSNVGIGISSPASLLHIQQAADSTSTSSPIALDVNSAGATGELTASSGNQTFTRIAPTVNQSSTAGYTTLAINNTETATGLGVKEALDIQLAGASRTTIASNGTVTLQDASSFVTPYGGFGRFENHIKRSAEFDDDTDWIKTNVTDPTANTLTAPDGSTTAEVLTNSADAGNVCNFSGTAAGSDTFTFSVWARSASGTQTFSLRVDAGATSCATANNVTGTEQSFTATTTWKRYSVTQTFSSATGNVKVRIFPDTSTGTGTDSIRVWGAQLEKQASPGVYAMTTSGTLTNTNRGRNVETNVTATSGFLYGGRHVMTIDGTAVASSTQVGEFIRVRDNTTSGVNSTTVRALEVQGYSGTNLKGINTGVASFAYTFGVHAETTAQANEQAQPAAVFADLNNGNAPTSGNAIRAFTNDATSADLVSFYQDTSSFTGVGLLMNFAVGSGTYTGNFIDLKKNGESRFNIDDSGAVAILNVPDADNEIVIEIDTEESTTTQSVFRITSDAQPTGDATTDNVKFSIFADGRINLSLNAGASTEAVCFEAPGGADVETSGVEEDAELYDCSGGPNADFAEMYPVAEGVDVGDVVVLGENLVNTYASLSGKVDWNTVKGQVKQLVKSTKAYQVGLIGIVSDNYSDFASTGYNIKDEDNPKSIALAGRVPVKASLENGMILAGDFVTSSATQSGFAMKATHPGMVLGQALSDYDPLTGMVMVFVSTGFYDPSLLITEDGNVDIQRGQSATSLTASTDLSAYLIRQNGAGDILQLQSGDFVRFLVKNDGTTILQADLSDPESQIFVVKTMDTEQFSINARGDVSLSGVLVVRSDSFAGSIATDSQGLAEVKFDYHLGTGKPVVQLAVEGEVPAVAFVKKWNKDADGNYVGFVIGASDLAGQQTSVIIHYYVIGKPSDYETNGRVLEIQTTTSTSTSQVTSPSDADTVSVDEVPPEDPDPPPGVEGGVEETPELEPLVDPPPSP